MGRIASECKGSDARCRRGGAVQSSIHPGRWQTGTLIDIRDILDIIDGTLSGINTLVVYMGRCMTQEMMISLIPD